MKVKIQVVDEPNANNHVYTKESLENVIKEFNEGKELFGGIDMPLDLPFNELQISHKITSLSIEGDYLVGEVEILETPLGEVLSKILIDGQLDLRMCGTGSLEKVVNENHIKDFTLYSVNAVKDGA
jgi:hypothetical protein